jgi:Type II secretion system (T2SS), protein E, N-terminal domain
MAMRLGDLLVSAGLLSPEQLEAARENQAKEGGRLGEALLRMGLVPEEVLYRALAKQTKIPLAQLSGPGDPDALAKLPREVVEEFVLVPVSLDRNLLAVAMSDPLETTVAGYLRAVSGCQIVPQLASPSQVREAIGRWYGPRAAAGAGAAAPANGVRARAAAADAALSDAALSDAALSDAALSDAGLSDAARFAAALPEHELHAATDGSPAPVITPRVPPQELPRDEGAQPGLTSLRSGRLALGAIALLFLALLAVSYKAFALRARLDDATEAVDAHLKTIALQAQQVSALDKLAARVDQFNQEFGQSVGKVKLEDIELGATRIDAKDLPPQVKRALDELEESATEIKSITAQLKEYQRYLGEPATVKRGDTHAQLALAYLTGQAGLAPKEAEQVLRHTALAWELEPGNQVFNLFHGGILLSTVTQGTAARSPLEAQWLKRRALQVREQQVEKKLKECEAGKSPPQ